MACPRIRLYQLYSFHLEPEIELILEQIETLRGDELHTAITKNEDIICLYPYPITIDRKEKTIEFTGMQLTSHRWIVGLEGEGKTYKLGYTYSDDKVLLGLEYLYHIYKNMTD